MYGNKLIEQKVHRCNLETYHNRCYTKFLFQYRMSRNFACHHHWDNLQKISLLKNFDTGFPITITARITVLPRIIATISIESDRILLDHKIVSDFGVFERRRDAQKRGVGPIKGAIEVGGEPRKSLVHIANTFPRYGR